jgi:hypothetical protein
VLAIYIYMLVLLTPTPPPPKKKKKERKKNLQVFYALFQGKFQYIEDNSVMSTICYVENASLYVLALPRLSRQEASPSPNCLLIIGNLTKLLNWFHNNVM